jgi:hypothetical protein
MVRSIVKTKVTKVEQLDDFDDEYVYDIGVSSNNKWFFGNNILVHNSSYFTASQLLKEHPALAEALSTREAMISFYDEIAEQANASFAGFMDKTFNTGLERGSIIKAGRELVGSRGLFITKKRYAILMYDKEGQRLDTDNSPGKIKAMGLDLKRSDTPKMMQEFLEQVLLDVLNGVGEEEVLKVIKTFRQKFRDLPAWQKGTPKKVNSVIDYTNRLKRSTAEAMDFSKPRTVNKKQNVTVPGHVQASLNWNMLRQKNNDRYSMEIQDGQKIIVCKLKPKNDYNMTSIAYPIDEMHLPEWFKNLPFDDDSMEETIIDKKIENLLGVLNWNLALSKDNNLASDLFAMTQPKLPKHVTGRPTQQKSSVSNDLFSF